ncbi:MAG: hypothetical protein IPL01_07490 [Acidobacteria bacterium]|nr:hypothetical protein [Acidobacteriota bacterium]
MVIFGVALALSVACLSSISGGVASGSTQRKPDDKPSTQKSGQSVSGKTKNSSGQSNENPGPELPVRQSQIENPVLEDLRIRAWSPKRFDQPDEAMRFYLNKRLPEGVTDFPVEKYFEAQELMKGMPQFSTVTNSQYPSQLQMRVSGTNQNIGTWSPLGPGNIGGRTRAILIDPQNTNLIYAAGVAGGVWKSSNGGQTWTPKSDLIANIAVTSMAFDPQNSNIIYAGTGEGFFNVDGVRGAGIFKSTDAGENWTRLAGTETADFYYVSDIVVSPNNSQRVYAATRTGVWKSTDGGVTWQTGYVTSIQGGCTDLAIRTDQTNDFLFASCGNFQQGQILRNINAASSNPDNWELVITDPLFGRSVIAIAPSNQNIVYAVTVALSGTYANGLFKFYRSASGGERSSWITRVNNTDSNKFNTAILSNPASATAVECKYGTSNSFSGQSWYDLIMAVDPLDENRVWVGSIDLFRSDDGGANWGLGGVVYPNEGPWRIHPDQHAIIFHPQYNGTTNQIMYVGNDGGLYRTDNARAPVAVGAPAVCYPLAASQVLWTPLNNNYGVTQFYHGVVTPDGKSYFGGTQDNGTVLGTDLTGSNNWKMINGADGGYSAVDFINPNTLYASTQNTGIRKSTDAGATFTAATFGLTESGLFITPIAMDPSEPRRLYTGGQNLFRSANGATSWTSVGSFRSISAGGSGTISAIAVASTDPNRALIGMNDGSIIRTDRLLTMSTQVPPSASTETTRRPRTGFVSWVAFDPNNKDIAFATYSTFSQNDTEAHVYRSLDGGLTWAPLDGTGTARIPNIPVHCLVVDPSNPARLYVGTDLGVFVSIDGGLSWSVENTGFANVVTEALILNIVDGVTSLYAFTHGRGVYKALVNNSGCSYAITPTTRNFSRDGGDLVVDVTAKPNGCNWKAQSNASWIQLAPNAQGSASGSFGLKVLANSTLSARAGTVTVGTGSFTITQEAQPDLSPPLLTVTSPAGVVVGTNSGAITILGTASDNGRVVSVAYQSSNGFGGNASGTTSWSLTSIPLGPGSNIITITATDDSGLVSRPALITVNASPAGVLTTVAGTGAQGFSGDNGPAPFGWLNRPARLAFDSSGNLFFADTTNHRIRRVNSQGVLSTIAGTGVQGFSGDNGPAISAQLNSPLGVAVDKDGNVYFSDSNNHRIRLVNKATGRITTVAGSGVPGYSGDGATATDANMNLPENVTLDKDGNIYFADSNNHRIRKVTVATGFINTIAGTGGAGFSGDGGPATSAQLRLPNDIFVGQSGDVWISDAGNVRVRKITTATGNISTIAGGGSQGTDGEGVQATSAFFTSLASITGDASGNLIVVDRAGARIRRIAGSDNTIRTIAGGASTGNTPDGSGALGVRLNNPFGVALDLSGRVVFSERDGHRIRMVAPAVAGDNIPPAISITAPTTASSYNADSSPIYLTGTASDNSSVVAVRWQNDRGGAGLAVGTMDWSVPSIGVQSGVNVITVTAIDSSGNSNSAAITVNFSTQSVIITAAGTGTGGTEGDNGSGVAANLFGPSGVVLDTAGNIYFTDNTNRRVRKISSNGVITAFAGTGDLGTSGDGGPATAATFNSPRGIAIDKAGNIYVGDSNAHKIRRISIDGKIATVAGTGSGFGDFGGDGGPALQGDLNGPQGIAVDKDGNLFIADRNNSRIRKVDGKTGIITTIAGTGTISFSGDGGPAVQAELFLPTGVAVDKFGNVFIADTGNQRIRRIDSANGTIATIAGTGVAGFNGDNIPASNAQINITFPTYLSIDSNDDLIFADRGNHRIRKITNSNGTISTLIGTGVSGFSGDGGSPTAASLLFPTSAVADINGNIVVADNNNNRIRKTILSSGLKSFATTSAASYFIGNQAPESIVAGFGSNLSTGAAAAATIPLPNNLGGVAIKIRDSLNVERIAPIFAVTSQQVNYLIPNGTATGKAALTVSKANGETSTALLNISRISPGIFSADQNGSGVAAALIYRRRANGSESYEAVARYDDNLKRFVPLPIDLGPADDQVSLLLFGTGFRFNSALENVSSKAGNISLPVTFAGAAPDFVGLDQANITLDRILSGKGEIDVVLTVDGIASNPVRIIVK